MIKKILVTGSNGTIGTRLCEFLLESGYEVIGLDSQPNKWNSKIDELTINADMRDISIFDNLPKDIDLVIHLAANSRVYDLINQPVLALDNVTTLFNILEYVRRLASNQLIFASSREVYGNIQKSSAEELDSSFDFCESPYAASKVSGEAFIRSYKKCFGTNFLIFRFSNVYGMYDDSNRVVPLFIKKARTLDEITVYGSEKVLDFIHIDDAIRALITGIEKFNEVKNDVFNITSGEETNIKNLALQIRDLTNKNLKIKIKENRTGEIMRFVGDNSKAKSKLDYSPVIKMDEGIVKAIKWYTNVKEIK